MRRKFGGRERKEGEGAVTRKPGCTRQGTGESGLAQDKKEDQFDA